MSDAARKKLLPAYLACGPDALKREAVVKRLCKRVGETGEVELNLDRFDGRTAAGPDIVNACNTMPFANDTRIVLVDNADRMRSADSEILASYLDRPNRSTVLCLLSESATGSTRLRKAVAALGAQAIIECGSIKRRDLPSHVRSIAVTHGVTITDSAAKTLIALVGEDTVQLDAELRKLALAHESGDPVGVSEVEERVARTVEPKPWQFADAFSARDVGRCLVLQSRMETVSPYALLAQCTARLRELLTAKDLAQQGRSHRLAAELKLPDWRVRNHARWAADFTPDELRSALVSARDAERAMKSGADPRASFDDWYLSVIARPRT